MPPVGQTGSFETQDKKMEIALHTLFEDVRQGTAQRWGFQAMERIMPMLLNGDSTSMDMPGAIEPDDQIF